MADSKKCPKCRLKFRSQKAFQKHYSAKHYKSKAKKKAQKKTWAIPGFAKRRKK